MISKHVQLLQLLMDLQNIAFDIPLSSLEAFWSPTASNICFAVSSFFTGPLSNVFGRQRMIILQVLCIIPGSILSGAAKNFATILAGRCYVGVWRWARSSERDLYHRHGPVKSAWSFHVLHYDSVLIQAPQPTPFIYFSRGIGPHLPISAQDSPIKVEIIIPLRN